MGKVKQRKAPKEKPTRASGRNVAADTKPAFAANADVAVRRPSIPSLLVYFVKVLILTTLSIPFWFLTSTLSLVYGRPPKVVFFGQTLRYIRYVIEYKDKKALPLTTRIDLIMTILLHSASSPVSGFCWLIDEILYGKQLNALSVIEPLFVLSAYRSASTEMARTLAKDTQRFVAPAAIMCAFPYLWLWKLVSWIVGDDNGGISPEEANGYLNKNFTKESLERHDNDHFAVDTFDGYFLSSHLNGLAFRLGSEVIVKEFNSANFEECNRYLFEHCFVDHVDRLARKTLLFNGITTPCSSSQNNKSFLLKGHFLSSANALQRKYPDARFLTVLRDPLDRLKSGINHAAVNPTLWRGDSPRWNWLSEAFQQIEVAYCEREMEWYGNYCGSGGDDDDCSSKRRRLAVKFDSFVKDFRKTMKRVYKDLLEEEEVVPDFVALSKVSKRYTVDMSLKDLDVDEKDLKRRLADYYAWMDKQ